MLFFVVLEEKFGEIGWLHAAIGLIVAFLAYNLLNSSGKVSFTDRVNWRALLVIYFIRVCSIVSLLAVVRG